MSVDESLWHPLLFIVIPKQVLNFMSHVQHLLVYFFFHKKRRDPDLNRDILSETGCFGLRLITQGPRSARLCHRGIKYYA